MYIFGRFKKRASFPNDFFCIFMLFMFGLVRHGLADVSSRPSWDQTILGVNIQNVSIDANSMRSASEEISKKYLIRMNLYMDAISDGDSENFKFVRNTATGKELLDAFIATYPAYIYTNDNETGVIWIYSKKTTYDKILDQRIKIAHGLYQVPVQDAVLIPIGRLISAQVFQNFPLISQSFDYSVDLPAGIYTYKDILNLCCIWNPIKAFEFMPTLGMMSITPLSFDKADPLAPPRFGALRFWENEIGNPTNGIPSAAEVGEAMGDKASRKRWAARCYFEAARTNYKWRDVVEKSGNPNKAVWAALGIEAAIYRGAGDPQFLVANVYSGFTTNLTQIKDPCLALVASLELTREKQGTNYLYLDAIVSQHKFTEAEIASIKPDVYRLVHESPLALDKLKSLKLEVPEFSPKALDELADTNLFTLVPPDKY